jgi:hypothetical protein
MFAQEKVAALPSRAFELATGAFDDQSDQLRRMNSPPSATAAGAQRLFPRFVRPLVIEGMDDSRIVFLGGARQVGKTTLVTDIARHERPMAAFTLDDRVTREAAVNDPAGFVADLEGPAFIDEIHRAPDLLLELKKAVDADTAPGRFVITGSANVLTSKRIQDALPGRIDRVDMWPLAQSEIQGGKLNVIDELFAGRAPQVTGAPVGRAAFSGVVGEGGYPEARARPPGRRRQRWFDNYVSGTLARDLMAGSSPISSAQTRPASRATTGSRASCVRRSSPASCFVTPRGRSSNRASLTTSATVRTSISCSRTTVARSPPSR